MTCEVNKNSKEPWWIIVRYNYGKPNYTAHLDLNCGTLMKPNSKKTKYPKLLRLTKDIGVHTPCKMCGGGPRGKYDRERWEKYDAYVAELRSRK